MANIRCYVRKFRKQNNRCLLPTQATALLTPVHATDIVAYLGEYPRSRMVQAALPLYPSNSYLLPQNNYCINLLNILPKRKTSFAHIHIFIMCLFINLVIQSLNSVCFSLPMTRMLRVAVANSRYVVAFYGKNKHILMMKGSLV